MSENTQCIASALRNAIINLGMIPKVVYQDNGRAFKAKYFQSCDFDEEGFNGVFSHILPKKTLKKRADLISGQNYRNQQLSNGQKINSGPA